MRRSPSCISRSTRPVVTARWRRSPTRITSEVSPSEPSICASGTRRRQPKSLPPSLSPLVGEGRRHGGTGSLLTHSHHATRHLNSRSGCPIRPKLMVRGTNFGDGATGPAQRGNGHEKLTARVVLVTLDTALASDYPPVVFIDTFVDHEVD